MKLFHFALSAVLITSSLFGDIKSITLSTDKVNPPKNILSTVEKIFNKTKEVNGITVVDKGNNPGKYFDGGVIVGEQARKNVENFDHLDFEVFSNQDWINLHKSHAHNVVVSWPDGRETYGIDKHIEDLKWLFIHAPDTKIKHHPVKIAAGNWTAVQGIMEGTFTKPMILGNGKTIKPTGKKFRVPMATFAAWKEGKIVHEWLFWDNQTYMKQMGL